MLHNGGAKIIILSYLCKSEKPLLLFFLTLNILSDIKVSVVNVKKSKT